MEKSAYNHSMYNSIADCFHGHYDEDGGHILLWPLTSTRHLLPRNSRRLFSPPPSGTNSHIQSPVNLLSVPFWCSVWTSQNRLHHIMLCSLSRCFMIGPSTMFCSDWGLTCKEAVVESWLGQKDLKRSQWNIFSTFQSVSSLKLRQKKSIYQMLKALDVSIAFIHRHPLVIQL